MLYLGLMSGTSLDGIDLALCRFAEGGYDVIQAETIPYPIHWEERLRQANDLPAQAFMQLDRALGCYLGKEVKAFLESVETDDDILICSHGHTIFHAPPQGMTVQIGHGPSLREEAGQPVLFDFRSADVAAGGQGAPLVPAAERDLFAAYTACINLGGFANVTILSNPIHAFDICACNTVLNDLSNKLNLSYDAEGHIAQSGTLLVDLFLELNALPFYQLPYPKSLGREYVQSTLQPILSTYQNASMPDLLHTYTEHIAWAISHAVSSLPAGSNVLVTGGGAFNNYLLSRIKAAAASLHFHVPDGQTVGFKEAIAFAYLGYLYQHGRPGNIPSVTGASGPRLLGALCA